MAATYNAATKTWSMKDSAGANLDVIVTGTSSTAGNAGSNSGPAMNFTSIPGGNGNAFNGTNSNGNDNNACSCCKNKLTTGGNCVAQLIVDCPTNKAFKGINTAGNAWCQVKNTNDCLPDFNSFNYVVKDTAGKVLAAPKGKMLDVRTGAYFVNVGAPAATGTLTVESAAMATPAVGTWTLDAKNAACEAESGSSLWPLWLILGMATCGIFSGAAYWYKQKQAAPAAKYDDFDTTYQNMDNSSV